MKPLSDSSTNNNQDVFEHDMKTCCSPSWVAAVTRRNLSTESIDGDDVGGRESTGLPTLQSRAAEKMDQWVTRAYHEKECAERYVRQKLNDAWNVCHFQHLPKWLQDNDYLHCCHRPQLNSFRACFLSVFRLHTETLNIWTHAIGCLIFTALAYCKFLNL